MQIPFIKFFYVHRRAPPGTCRLTISASLDDVVYYYYFYFLSSLLSSWSVPPTGCYWFLTAFCYFLLWTHTVDAMKGAYDLFAIQSKDTAEGERMVRGNYFVFLLPYLPSFVLLLLSHPGGGFQGRTGHEVHCPLSSLLLLNYFPHPLSFCHTSPLCSALQKNLWVSGLREEKNSREAREHLI